MDAGLVREVAGQLAKLLGAGADALSDAVAAVKKLGAAGARKLLDALASALPGMNPGTRSRFSRAILSVAMSAGALAATGCVTTMTGGVDMSYNDYRAAPQVVQVVATGILREPDVRRIYVQTHPGRQLAPQGYTGYSYTPQYPGDAAYYGGHGRGQHGQRGPAPRGPAPRGPVQRVPVHRGR